MKCNVPVLWMRRVNTRYRKGEIKPTECRLVYYDPESLWATIELKGERMPVQAADLRPLNPQSQKEGTKTA